MDLWAALIISLASLVLLNQVMLPRLRKVWLAQRTLAKVARTGVIAWLTALRDTAFAATLVFGAFGTVIVILWLTPSRNLSVLQTIVSAGGEALERLEGFCKFVDRWYTLVPVTLLWALWWHGRQRANAARLRRVADNQVDDLNEQRRTHPDAWGKLEPTPEMKDCDTQINGLTARVATYSISTSTGRGTRQRLLREVMRLKDKREQLDYERRVQWDAFGSPEEGGAKGKVPVWLSQGLFDDLQGLTKWLHRATTALVCLTFIGLSSETGAQVAVKEQLTRLDGFRVQAAKQDPKVDWRQTVPPADQELDEQDQQAIQYLSEAFARALIRNAAWRPLEPPRVVEQTIRRMLVERAILSETRVPAPDGHPTEYAQSRGEPDLAAALTDETGRADTRLGEAVARRRGKQIKVWFGKRWSTVREGILHHASTYHEPVRVHDVESALVDQFLTNILDPTPSIDGARTFADVVQEATSDATVEAGTEAVDVELRRMVMRMVDGESLESAAGHVKSERAAFPVGAAQDLEHGFHSGGPSGPGGPDEDDLGHALMASRPSGPRPPPPSSEALKIADDIAREVTDSGRRSMPDGVMDAMATYGDHFPSSSSEAASSALGQFESHWRLPADRPAFEALESARISRSVSFSMLRGFSRVGGVLIGRPPERRRIGGEFSDIEWTMDADSVEVLLVRHREKPIRIGRFPKAVVHQALAYAADRRPVAATMTTAWPLQQLKIHVHPTLVDTKLGCEITELDRFVDVFTKGTLPERQSVSVAFMQQVACYNFARASRLRAAADHLGPAAQQLLLDYAKVDSATLAMVDATLPEPAILMGAGSIFTRKPEFFSSELVELVRKVSKRAATHEEFADLVQQAFDPNDLRSKERVRELTVPAARFQVWSGVRERSFVVDGNGSFLTPPRTRTIRDQLWPFDFVIQVAFTSPAVNVRDPDTYSDEHPLEFTALEDKIESQVAENISANGLDEMLGDVRAFTILQRLFRSALSGALGSDFPMEKLVRLAHDTAGATQFFYTRRWNGSVVTQVREQGLQVDPAELQRVKVREEAFDVTEDERRSRAQGTCVPPFQNIHAPTPQGESK